MTYLATQIGAARMIAEKGQDVTLTRKVEGDYDPATSSAAITETIVVTAGVVLPLSRGLMHGENSSILVGDKQLLIPGDIDEPEVGDTVTVGSDVYTVIEVSPLNPGGTALIYDCMIRGAQ